MVGLTKALGKELGPVGVRVNAVVAGLVETNMISSYSNEQRERLAAMTSLRRLGKPEDIAGVVLFLASDLARYVTATTVRVDGGM